MLFKVSEGTAARRRFLVYMVDDTDGKTPETGQTLSAGEVKISKNGGAEANHAGALTELAGGAYYYECTSGELDTIGMLSWRLVKSGIRTLQREHQVVTYDPYATNLGLSGLPTAAPGATGGLPIVGSGTAGQILLANGLVALTPTAEAAVATATHAKRVVHSGTASAAGQGPPSTITVPGLPAIADYVRDLRIRVVGTTAPTMAQVRTITAQTTAGVLTLDKPWRDLPEGTITFEIFADRDGFLDDGGVTASYGAANDSLAGLRFNAPSVATIQSGLATSSALSTAQGDITNIQARIPQDLVGTAPARMDCSVGAVAPNAITAAGLDPDVATEIVTAMLAALIETGLTLKAAMQLIAAAAQGLGPGSSPTSAVYKSADIVSNNVVGSKNRITATVDASGNRTAILVDLT